MGRGERSRAPLYSPRQALVVFKRAFTAEGRVIVSHHFRQAMVDATDPFAMEDVLSVRAQGAIGRSRTSEPASGPTAWWAPTVRGAPWP